MNSASTLDDLPESGSVSADSLPDDSPTKTHPDDGVPSDGTPSGNAPRSTGRGAAGWALLLALLSVVAAGFALWQAHVWRSGNASLRDEIARHLKENDATTAQANELAKKTQLELETARVQIALLTEQVDKNQGQAAALNALYQQFSRSQDDRIIAEVGQAVAIATQQLQYAGNVETALIALRAAQARMKQNDHGQFSDLHRALNADIEKLSKQGLLDMPGTALQLEHVLEKVDSLPLAYTREIPPEQPPAVKEEEGNGAAHFVHSVGRSIWRELRSLVRIERISKNNEPVLLAPEQSAFLRENVKIRLLTARLAMLAHDGHTYTTDLRQAREWIERYFDIGNSRVTEVVGELSTLEALPVSVRLLELTDSVSAVRRASARPVQPSDAALQP